MFDSLDNEEATSMVILHYLMTICNNESSDRLLNMLLNYKPYNVKSNNFFDWIPQYTEKALKEIENGFQSSTELNYGFFQ